MNKACTEFLTCRVVFVMQKLMISMQIRVTPTFCLFRGTEVVKTVTGVNAENLQNAVREQLAGQQQA